MYIFKLISFVCEKIIKSSCFEFVSILVIIVNSIILANDNPNNSSSTLSDDLETIFLTIYTVEMTLKIIALGIVFPRNSYLRNSWNILDFVIIITGYVRYILSNQINLNALRSLRVLRPLRKLT